MSKKKDNQIAEPVVQNNINMNLNHNDIVDVAIQAQLEILEPRKEYLEKETREIGNNLDSLHRKILLKACERAGFAPSVKLFMQQVKDFAKVMKVSDEPKLLITDVYSHDSRSSKTLETPSFTECPWDPEEHSKPLMIFRRNSRPGKRYLNLASSLTIRLESEVAGIRMVNKDPLKIEIPAKEFRAICKEVQDVLDQYAALMNERYNVTKEYLELKYDEKKIKARVVRASLSRTTEGMKILKLLESATNIKLLG